MVVDGRVGFSEKRKMSWLVDGWMGLRGDRRSVVSNG